ncbi:unnamed protein product [Brassica oleracea]
MFHIVSFWNLRIDRVVGFTSRCLKSKQERFRIMSFKGNAAMDGGSKKEKMVNLVWRPISTRSSSVVYSEAAEGQCSKPSGVSERAPVVSAGKHSVPLEVGASLMKFIKGKEGTTQMKIEDEMGVKIIFPSSRNEDHIIIEGGSVDCVTKASERIATIVDEVVKSPSLDYSHFVSLPLAIHPELVAKLVNFQNSILGNQSIAGDKQDKKACSSDMLGTFYKMADLGIEKSIFIKPSTFHLTVLMLKLWKKDRFNTARDVLKSISPSVMDALDNQPIFIRLKGLDCMRGSLAKARVLYIPVEEIGDEGRLLRACSILAFSVNVNFITLCGLRKKMDSFDAREIHKQFGNEDWGEYLIQEAHLSQRFRLLPLLCFHTFSRRTQRLRRNIKPARISHVSYYSNYSTRLQPMVKNGLSQKTLLNKCKSEGMSSSRKLKMMRRRELPFELVVEILARVPVKDLIRFRCVCKTWRSLFQDERFYRQHMTHAPTRIVSFRLSDILLGRFSCDNSGNKAEMILQANNILNARGERLVIDASLLGHCHGLFCFCFDNRIFGVWNPSLRVLREIRKPDVREWSEMGFGYDPSSQDYKIVLLLKKQGIHSEALVFSLKSGASRMIEFRDIGMLHSRVPGTLVGENIYWHVYDAKVKVTDKFLGFDLVSETFKFYPGPSNCVKGFPEVIAGGLRGGGLCTVGVDALSGGLIVWSAQHDDKIGGGIKSWSKICILSPGILEISTSCRIHRIFVVSAITYAGLLLVLVDIDGKESMKRESKLLAYNLEEKSLTNVETSLSLYSCGHLLTYVETLVPIPGRWKL